MVFAPKKVAQDIGWGTRNEQVKRCDASTSHEHKTQNHHGLKEEEATLAPLKASLKRRARSRDECLTTSPQTSSALSPSVHREDKKLKGAMSIERNKNCGNIYDATEGRKPPLKGKVLPDVELHIAENENCILSCSLTMEPSSTIAFVGRAKVIVHEGCVEILGYQQRSTKSSEAKAFMIDCPSWMNALTISSVPSLDNAQATKKYHTKIEFVSQQPHSFSYHFMTVDEARSRISIDHRWNMAVNEIIDGFSSGDNQNSSVEHEYSLNRILVCGAKNVGKSTFAKYLCNRFLSLPRIECVAYLDCDVGQPELSPPGMLSLTILTKPLLCPPHVHLVCHEDFDNDLLSYGVASEHYSAYFYGSTSSKVNPLSYSQVVHQLMKDFATFCDTKSTHVPLIVNTDGWVKGMGYEMLSSIIETVKPANLIQIIGSTKAKFFDMSSHANPNCKIHVLFSQSATGMKDEANGLSAAIDFTLEKNVISPALLRNLRLCTYFLGGNTKFHQTGASVKHYGIIDDDCNIAFVLSKQKPYMVPFDAFTFTVLSESGIFESFSFTDDDEYPDYLYNILNGSVVGLCTNSEGCNSRLNAIHKCVGLGVVRSIDRARRMYYILTPVPISILQSKVTYIVHGEVHLPFECVFLGHNAMSFPYQSSDGGAENSKSIRRKNSFEI